MQEEENILKMMYCTQPADKEMIWEEEDKVKYDKESSCYICNEPFITIVKGSVMECRKLVKVRDHCDYAGKYRGTAHSNCNVQ